ncbi:MAG: cellulase family glycosylhydrolase [Saprospiraceae bacterium]|nr:cellulase family glycosylhydrolase [Saprospiraceae bacterium]MBP7923966.1 cellulase family glycosylhydrolase [Saprospiraceae bacterium]
MKRSFYLFVLLAPFLFLSFLAVASSPPFHKFKINKGTNIAHWLSQSTRRGTERSGFFTEKDIQYIHQAGFDHIRLPIDEEQLWTLDGRREEEAFKLMGDCIQWCERSGLRVIIDLHILRSHHFNAAEKPLWTKPEEQDKFIALWKDLSGFLHTWPQGLVAYEIMNEPVADDPEQWNHLIARAVSVIRDLEPNRTIVIGSNRWQSAQTFDQLKVPAHDPNIILSYHFYEPFYLSHIRASWTKLKDFTGEVNYPGPIVVNGTTLEEQKIYNRDTLEKMMSKPFQLARKLHLPLYCGEFGIIDKAPIPPKLAWYRDMVSIFKKHHVSYANWNYKAGSFGIVDKDMVPDEKVVSILVN